MNRKFRLCFVSLLLCTMSCGLAENEAIAQDYPKKAIRCIVPSAAGGGTDILARYIGEKLGSVLGQPVLVDNRIGADQRIGTEMVARAAPDGYTMLAITNAHTVQPAVFKSLPYDPVKDFTAIAIEATAPNFLLVHPSVPAKSVADLIKLAKSKPGKLNCGITGIAQTPHLNLELFKSAAGVDIMLVPFKGGGENITNVLGGHVDMAFNSVAASISYVKAGTLRALAITADRRSVLAPEVPTMEEAGCPGVTVVTWYGLLAPAGTPKQIIAKLNTEIEKILAMPDVRGFLIKQGYEPTPPTTPEAFAKYIKDEIARCEKAVRAAGIPRQ